MQAAREVLAEKGLDAARVSEIVARAGVAQGTFYLYFPSKPALVMALGEEMNTEMLAAVQQAVSQADSFTGAINEGVAATFEVMGRYRDVLNVIHSRLNLAEMRALCEEMYQPFYGFISGLIRQAQSAGMASADVNPELSARLIVGLCQYAGDECFVTHAQTPSEAYIAEVARFIRSALGLH